MVAPRPAAGAEAVTQPELDLRACAEHAVAVVGMNGNPEVRGSRCLACGTLMVPETFACSACACSDVQPASAGSTGNLYSYSTVYVSPSRATPYTLGYVDLDAGARVLATISGDSDSIRPDVRVGLVIDLQGEWSFAPILGEERS